MTGTEELRQAERNRPLILIVEDQLELRELYVQQLTMSGFDVIEAGNGADDRTHSVPVARRLNSFILPFWVPSSGFVF